MSQNDELTRVKTRIKALTEKTVARGCTEAEAMAAAEMVGRLLERYALTMEEVDVRQEPCVQVEVSIGGQRRRPIDVCVPAIARFCDCKVWLTRVEQQASYVFFGFETDAGLAAYLVAVIDRAIKTELAGFRNSRTSLAGTVLRRASASFQHGMAARVAERLEAMLADREAAVAGQRSTGTALIVLRHQVVEDAFRASKIRLHVLVGLTLRQNAAFRAGRVAGERVHLNRPVGNGGTELLS
ncbi:MAG: DUF2786 domain-containing protein [Alphaproteobacteria bacterium]|nr:DUF2786 domain-containing protein [Alphaproteobacteria bacterium]